MSYVMANGRYAHTIDLDLDPAADTVTVDAYSANSYELGDRACVRLVLDVTAVSSGETLDVTVETSSDGSTWYSAGTFTQVTGTGTERKAFPIDRYVRANYNITSNGSPEITCTLRGEAV